MDREIRIRVEKEISISTCRNGYAAVNRPVAPPPPHKYSIKFIRTNISSRREILSRSIRPRFIRPMTDSASSSLRYPTRSRFPIVQTRYDRYLFSSTNPYPLPPFGSIESESFLWKNRKKKKGTSRSNINSSIEFTKSLSRVPSLRVVRSTLNFKLDSSREIDEYRGVAVDNFQHFGKFARKFH